VPHYRELRAELLNSLGTLHRVLMDKEVTDEQIAQLEEAVAIAHKLSDQFPQEIERQVSLAKFESSLGEAYQKRGQEDKSKPLFDSAMKILEQVSRQTGDIVDTLYTLGELQYTIAEQLEESDRTDDAMKMLDAAEGSFNRLAKLAPRFREVHLALANVFIDRSNCLETKGLLVDGMKELDRLTAKSAELGELTTAPWMRSILKTLLVVAKTQRLGFLLQVRGGELNKLADRGDYQLAGDQARAFFNVTMEPSDHFVAASTLAYAANAAAANAKLSENERREIVEPLAADAVKELGSAWESGYLRRRTGGFAGLLGSQISIKDVERNAMFKPLLERPDFKALVQRIDHEESPKNPKPAADQQNANKKAS
jgi:tetratricopeptide (TPR) repeat protein